MGESSLDNPYLPVRSPAAYTTSIIPMDNERKLRTRSFLNHTDAGNANAAGQTFPGMSWYNTFDSWWKIALSPVKRSTILK